MNQKAAYKHSEIEVEGKEAIILTRSQFETMKDQLARTQEYMSKLEERIEKLEKK